MITKKPLILVMSCCPQRMVENSLLDFNLPIIILWKEGREEASGIRNGAKDL